jgi:tetratricopeptide (TPR) repeat protein
MDVESINSGTFDTIILNQIAARPYFLLILTPGTLERCTESGDWLLREMQQALRLQRIIIPLVTPEFLFDDIKKYLTGQLAAELPRYNAVKLDHDYFEAGMERLVNRFLVPVAIDLTPTPATDAAAVESKIAQATAEPEVTQDELSAQAAFESAYKHSQEGNFESAIIDYTEAIRLNPKDASAFNNRGIALDLSGYHDDAIADFNAAIRLESDYANAYNNRGAAYGMKKDWAHAIADYTEAIRCEPTDPVFYYNRGEINFNLGNYMIALPDFQQALKLSPQMIHAQVAVPLTWYKLGQIKDARTQWQTLITADERYADPLWLNAECMWEPSMLDTAREVIESLKR